MQSTVDSTAELEVLDEIGDAGAIAQPGLRARLEASRPVVSVRTFDTMQIAYPTRYAFWGAAILPSPFAIMTQRVFLVRRIPRALCARRTWSGCARGTR
ncbi:hypothetical protein AB3662_05145 [Sorangium cellulosum]|uniref:hypothetical protein n=1 Tax=Sorangium cellulosum TaxID=56 RepID=UPI003D9A52FF